MFSKCAVVLLLVLPLFAFAAPTPSEEAQAFEKFKKDFDRHYETPAEEAKRFEIFKKNLAEIQQLNEKHRSETTFAISFAINQFTDLSKEEFAKSHTGDLPTPN
uniref:Inhibitor_I29 domain-containing protein n=1 Tax=Steinernema glaseri TaxID=37863 RepID=A0A1I7YBB2_9BILA